MFCVVGLHKKKVLSVSTRFCDNMVACHCATHRSTRIGQIVFVCVFLFFPVCAFGAAHALQSSVFVRVWLKYFVSVCVCVRLTARLAMSPKAQSLDRTAMFTNAW